MSRWSTTTSGRPVVRSWKFKMTGRSTACGEPLMWRLDNNDRNRNNISVPITGLLTDKSFATDRGLLRTHQANPDVFLALACLCLSQLGLRPNRTFADIPVNMSMLESPNVPFARNKYGGRWNSHLNFSTNKEWSQAKYVKAKTMRRRYINNEPAEQSRDYNLHALMQELTDDGCPN